MQSRIAVGLPWKARYRHFFVTLVPISFDRKINFYSPRSLRDHKVIITTSCLGMASSIGRPR